MVPVQTDKAPCGVADAVELGDTLRWSLLVFLAAGVGAAAWVASRPSKRQDMSFLAHVDELRKRILWAVVAFLLGTTFAFGFRWTGSWPRPALHDNLAAQVYQMLAAALVPPNVQLVATSPLDGFVAEFTVAMGLGFAFALPVILWQVGGFFAPALKTKEQRALAMSLIPATLLFLAGAWFAFAFVLPFLFVTLYAYTDALGALPLLRIQDFITFSLGLIMVMGIAFQTPLVMVFLTRVGAVQARTWRRMWRHAIIAILVASALVTDPTLVSQVMVALPLFALYGIGAGVATLIESSRPSGSGPA